MMNITVRYSLEKGIIYRRVFEFVSPILKLIGLEATIWIFGLVYLALINTPQSTHFTICPFANLGIDFCPGCGLGNSISYLFRGELFLSFYSHPLGIIALIIITLRIVSIIKNNWRRYA